MPRVYPLVPRRAEGCVIEDVDGNRFLDLNAGIAVTATGHCHPAVVAAIEDQAAAHAPLLLERLLPPGLRRALPAPGRPRAVRRCAGAGVPRQLRHRGGRGRDQAARATTPAAPHLIAFLGGFHGRTMGSLSLTASKARYRAGFGPLLPGVQHVPYGDGRARAAARRSSSATSSSPEEVAAIVVEPVQGEGGYVARAGRLPGRPAGALRRARHPARGRRGAERDRPHRAVLGHRARRRRSRTSSSRARAWPAACRSAPSSPGPT